jgi:hypothetical protein
MATLTPTRLQKAVRKSVRGALLALALGGGSVHASSASHLPLVGPQAPPPQGVLTVYSEWYVRWDGDVAVVERRPVELQTMEGQVIGTYTNSGGDSPLRFAVPPGHYLVVTESHWSQRKVEANVEDGQETIVPEALFD